MPPKESCLTLAGAAHEPANYPIASQCIFEFCNVIRYLICSFTAVVHQVQRDTSLKLGFRVRYRDNPREKKKTVPPSPNGTTLKLRANLSQGPWRTSHTTTLCRRLFLGNATRVQFSTMPHGFGLGNATGKQLLYVQRRVRAYLFPCRERLDDEEAAERPEPRLVRPGALQQLVLLLLGHAV